MPLRTLTTMLTAALVAFGVMAAVPAQAQQSDTVVRIEGPTRVETAIAISGSTFEDGQSDTVVRIEGPTRVETAIGISSSTYGDGQAAGVVLTTSDNFPDAQAGATLAAWVAAGPVLLTPPTALHPATAEEISRVTGGSGVVYLLGGTAAISDAVEQQVRDLGLQTERLAGPSRDTTAIAIAERTNSDPARIFIADGDDFTTSLIAGPAASLAVGNASAVVALTRGTTASSALDGYLAAHPGAELIALGNDAAAAVPQARSISAPSPAALSVAVASEFFPSERSAQVGVPQFGLASSDNWPDGLAGGASGGTFGFPLLLTPQHVLEDAVAGFIQSRGFSSGAVFGGPVALSQSVLQATEVAASGRTPPDPAG